jgi:site-specific DNA recombinase
MRAAIYSRVAVKTPVKDIAVGSRLEALRSYAANHGMTIIEEFADQGYSGLRLERPGLDRMRDLAQSNGFDVLLAYDAERIARSHVLLVLILEELEGFGVKTIFVQDGAVDDPLWRPRRQITVAESELEQAKVTERCRRGNPSRAKGAGIDPAPLPASLVEQRS